MKRLFIDADACPVIDESLAVARSLNVPVVMVGNYTQNLRRFQEEVGVEVVEVETERDEADFVIERIREHQHRGRAPDTDEALGLSLGHASSLRRRATGGIRVAEVVEYDQCRSAFWKILDPAHHRRLHRAEHN